MIKGISSISRGNSYQKLQQLVTTRNCNKLQPEIATSYNQILQKVTARFCNKLQSDSAASHSQMLRQVTARFRSNLLTSPELYITKMSPPKIVQCPLSNLVIKDVLQQQHGVFLAVTTVTHFLQHAQ